MLEDDTHYGEKILRAFEKCCTGRGRPASIVASVFQLTSEDAGHHITSSCFLLFTLLNNYGYFRFSHMSGILWECGTAERSEASTALNARTRVRAKKNGNLRCRNQSAACAAHSIWAFIPIHVDLPVSSYPFFLSLLSQAVAAHFYS